MPAYNEQATIRTIVARVLAVDLGAVDTELVIVDDGSTDGTRDILKELDGKNGVRVLFQPHNQGKGAAVWRGIQESTGDMVIIQDADLEYDPADYVPMLQALLSGKGDIVYGSRYLGRGRHDNQSLAAYLGGRSLSVACLLATGRYLTDTVTAYKLFRRTDLASLDLQTTGFELDHEITARMLSRGRQIVEVPITYAPRSREEGKKIGVKDWFKALRTFHRFRNG